MTDRASVLTELAKAVAGQERRASPPERLFRAAAGIIGARGASLTIAYTAPFRVTLCSNDDEAISCTRFGHSRTSMSSAPGQGRWWA